MATSPSLLQRLVRSEQLNTAPEVHTSRCYQYSCYAEALDVQVPQDVREARRDELQELQQDVGQSFAESLVGRQVFMISPLLSC